MVEGWLVLRPHPAPEMEGKRGGRRDGTDGSLPPGKKKNPGYNLRSKLGMPVLLLAVFVKVARPLYYGQFSLKEVTRDLISRLTLVETSQFPREFKFTVKATLFLFFGHTCFCP